jgi:hypothetical protein
VDPTSSHIDVDDASGAGSAGKGGPGIIAAVAPDGRPQVATADIDFPKGMVVSPTLDGGSSRVAPPQVDGFRDSQRWRAGQQGVWADLGDGLVATYSSVVRAENLYPPELVPLAYG